MILFAPTSPVSSKQTTLALTLIIEYSFLDHSTESLFALD